MTVTVSQEVVEVAQKQIADNVLVSQEVIEVGQVLIAKNWLVSQHVIEVAILVSGRVYGPAVSHI